MAEDKLAQALITRFGQAVQEREIYESVWEQIAEYLIPNRYLLMKDMDRRGIAVNANVFDGSPIHAAQLCSNGIMGYMVSPNYKWHKLKMGRDDLNVVSDVKLYLQACEEALYGEFNDTNFYPAMARTIRDGVTLATATTFVDDDLNKNRLQYITIHPKEIFIDTNAQGEVDTVYRYYDMTVRQAIQFFGRDALSDDIKRQEKDQSHVKHKFLMCVYPRTDRIEGKKGNLHMPYAVIYIEYNAKKVVKTGGAQNMNPFVWRWNTDSGEKYGRGPGSNALKDVLMLNQIGRTNLLAAQKTVDPAMFLPVELRGRLNLNPGGRNWMEGDFSRIPIPAVTGIAPQHAVEREARLTEIIRQHFYVDFFLMLATSEREMTAREVVEKQGEKAAVLSSIVGNFGKEVLDQVIGITFYKMAQGGRLPDMPPILQDLPGEEIRIEYMGPLAQAQRTLIKSQGIMRFLEVAVPMIQIAPETKGILNWVEAVKELADAYGVPEKLINSDRQIQAFIENMQAQQQQQAQIAQTGVIADAAGKMNKTIEPNSLAEQLIPGLGGRR